MIRIVVPSYTAGATTANGVDASKKQFLSCPNGCGKMFPKQKHLRGHLEKGCDGPQDCEVLGCSYVDVRNGNIIGCVLKGVLISSILPKDVSNYMQTHLKTNRSQYFTKKQDDQKLFDRAKAALPSVAVELWRRSRLASKFKLSANGESNPNRDVVLLQMPSREK